MRGLRQTGYFDNEVFVPDDEYLDFIPKDISGLRQMGYFDNEGEFSNISDNLFFKYINS